VRFLKTSSDHPVAKSSKHPTHHRCWTFGSVCLTDVEVIQGCQRPVFKTWTMILLVKVSKFWTIDF
jgi:hypothetical protein